MAVTDARSRFWLGNAVPAAIRRRNRMNANHRHGTSLGLPDPVALRPAWKGNLIFLLVVAVVVLAVAS
jgi:hypothetical protein